MAENKVQNINPAETQHPDDNLQKELIDLQKKELIHIEDEFEGYKLLYVKDDLESI